MKVVVFDTETTGKAKSFKKQAEEDLDNYPYMLQLGFKFFEIDINNNYSIKNILDYNKYIKPFRLEEVNFEKSIEIEPEAINIHGITFEKANKYGIDLLEALYIFQGVVNHADYIVAHNMQFDRNVIVSEFLRLGLDLTKPKRALSVCTMKSTVNILKLKPKNSWQKGYKWPSLEELSQYLLNKGVENAHDAFADVEATSDCFIELVKRDYFK